MPTIPTPNAASKVFPVRGAVKLNGELIDGWTEFEVQNNSFSSADSFSVKFAANALPADRDAGWFAAFDVSNTNPSANSGIDVELYVGTPADANNWAADDLPKWIYGRVDSVKHNLLTGIISIAGRDLTGLMIDTKTTIKYQNKTSSQIAALLAAKYNLTPQITPTKIAVGKFFEIDHEHALLAQTEWEMLTQLARIEQYTVYVRDTTLYFQPQPDPASAPVYPIVWTPPDAKSGHPTCAVESLEFDRALTISKGTVVSVSSLHHATGKAFTVNFPSSSTPQGVAPGHSTPGKTSKYGGNTPQTYYYVIANSTPQACLQFAQAKYAEIVQHEITMSFDIPGAGNDALDVTGVIAFSGTGLAWDQQYFPDSLTRRLSLDTGYTLAVHAKNHSPSSQVQGT